MARLSTEILVTDLGDLDCIPMSFNEDLLLSDFLDYDGLELDPLLDLPISLENESRGGAKSTVQAANPRLPRSHRLRISEEQKRHLTDWTSRNPEPYPTKEEKADLSELTGMTVAQVSSWFSRLRQRKLQRVNQPILSSPLVPDVESRAEPLLDLHARPKSFSFDDDHGADHRLFLQTGSLDISILHHSANDDNREPFLRASSLPAAITLHHLRCFSSIPLNKQDGPLSLEAVASLHGEPDSRLKETTEAHSSFPSHLPRLALPVMLSKTSFVENWIRNIGCSHPSPANVSNVQSSSVQVPLTAGVRDPDVQGDQSSTTSGTADDNVMERHFSRSPLEAPVGVSDHGSNAGTTSDYASSHGSAGSASSYISLGPRQGRRVAFVDQSTTPLKRKASEGAAKQPSAKRRNKTTTPTVKWVCSFCQRVFSTRFTWQRHEKSAHLTPDRWICGYSLWDDASLDCPVCATGGIRQPLGSCGHRFPECLRRPEGARTFYRRDALTQHLKVFHCKDQKWPQQIAPLHLDEWVIHSEPALAALVCPFCGFQAPNWEARVKHIAKHYESGLNLAVPVSSGPGSFIQSIDTHPLTKRLLEDSLICRRGKKLQDYRRVCASCRSLRMPHLCYGVPLTQSCTNCVRVNIDCNLVWDDSFKNHGLDDPFMICPLCNIIFREKKTLCRHCQLHHMETIIEHVEGYHRNGLRCLLCEQGAVGVALHASSLYRHMLGHRSDPNPGSDTCPICRSLVPTTELEGKRHVKECMVNVFVGNASFWGCHAFYI